MNMPRVRTRYLNWLALGVMVFAALALAACSGGGGGSGGGSGGEGDDSGGTTAECGDEATCTNVTFTVISEAMTAAFTAIGSNPGGTISGDTIPCNSSGSITINGSYDDTLPIAVTSSLTLAFNACHTVSTPNDFTINGPFNFSSTFDQTNSNYGNFTMASTGLSVSGVLGGAAVNFSCAFNITMTFNGDGYTFSSTVCGQAFHYP